MSEPLWVPLGAVPAATIFDAKGDLIIASGPDTPARLPVGANGDLLIADASQALGARWGAGPSVGGTWAAYTPTLTAPTTNPVLGTGSVQSGRYCVLGKQVAVQVQINFGTSGMSAGSGVYGVSTPLPLGTMEWIGNGLLRDTSTNNASFVQVVRAGASLVNFYYPATWPSGALQGVSNSTPWVWAASDQINLWWIQETP